MQKNIEKRRKPRQLLLGALLLVVLAVVCVLVYKAQVRDKLYKPVKYTMMTEHKTVAEVVLSRELPEVSEVFTCSFPDLKRLNVQYTAVAFDPETTFLLTLADAKTGEIYARQEYTAADLGPLKLTRRAMMRFSKPIEDSKGRKLRLTCQLKNPGTTLLALKANQKQALVDSFQDLEGDRTNVVYGLYYGDNSCLRVLYALLCAALLTFAALCYWMIVIRRMTVEKFYVPMALMLGLILQCVITVYGVPDEAEHFDTAYKYSNQLLLTEDTGNPGTIYKRRCDVEISDLLANGLESNSYYQLLTNTFRKPENTQLMEVSYVDTTNLVPGVVYLFPALGISLGRLLGASAMLTMQLARIFNLIFFVFVVWASIRLVPFGKNLWGMLGLLPIALQQGASASYDAMMNGLLMLFLALYFRFDRKMQKKVWELPLMVLLAVFAAVTKGGAYLPLLLLPAVSLFREKRQHRNEKKRRSWMAVLGAAAVIMLVIALVKVMPVLQSFLQESGDGTGYTLSYIFRHPLNVIYLYWNTLMLQGDFLLQGLLGGTLSWLDLKMSWLFLLVFLAGLLLMVNVEGDRYDGSVIQRVLMAAACGISIVLILLSMLVSFTKTDASYIQGLQGRYFYPLAPLLVLLTANDMVHVKHRQAAGIWMAMAVTEILFVLQATALIG